MGEKNYWNSIYDSRVVGRRLSRRRLIKLGALGAAGTAGAVYLGCGGDDDEEEGGGGTPGADRTSVPEGTPQAGGTMSMVLGGPLSTMDSRFHSVLWDKYAIYNVYEGLTVAAEDNIRSAPQLAEKWEIVDGTTFIFNLRKGVQFHDGTEFTTGAVKSYFDFIMKPESASPRLAEFPVLDRWEADDDYTMTFHLREVSGFFIGALGSWQEALPSPAAIEKWGADYKDHPVGTGAFMFKRQEPGTLYEFERNPNYRRAGEPFLDGFKARVITDTAVAAAALKAGEIDYATRTELDTQDILAFQDDADFNVVFAGAGNLGTIWANKKREPGNNLHLRKAISYAVNREEFVDKYSGLAFVTPGPIPRYSLYDNPDEPEPEYDPEKAKEELKAAGYEDGITIKLIAMAEPVSQADVELLTAQLAKTGITVDSEFFAMVQAGVKLNSGDYDFAYGPWPTESPGDTVYALEQVYCSDGFYNQGTTDDPEIDSLFDKARRELDAMKQRDYYWQIMKIINENAYMIYVVGTPQLSIIRKNLHGFIPMNQPGGYALEKQFRRMWLA